MQKTKENNLTFDDLIPNVRINHHQKEILENHLLEKGLNLTTGVRVILIEYLKNNKLI